MESYEPEPRNVPYPSEEAIHDRLHALVDELEESERGAVLAFFDKVLEGFERRLWKPRRA